MEKFRAVVAVGLFGRAVVLSTDSEQIVFDLEHVGSCPRECGILPAGKVKNPGLYLVEGTVEIKVSHPDEPGEPFYTTTAEPTYLPELHDLLKMSPPDTRTDEQKKQDECKHEFNHDDKMRPCGYCIKCGFEIPF